MPFQTKSMDINITFKWNEKQFAAILARLTSDDSKTASELTEQLRGSEEKLKAAIASDSTPE